MKSHIKHYQKNIEKELGRLKGTKVEIDDQIISAYEYLRRPNTNYEDIEKIKRIINSSSQEDTEDPREQDYFEEA